MTVRELMEILSHMPADAPIALQEIEEDDGWFEEVVAVELQNGEVRMYHSLEW